MFWLALFAFLVLPGVVAYGLPMLWLHSEGRTRLAQPLGLLPLAIGTLALLACARDFYVAGRGTLAPWSPPRELVVVGLYRFSRNPMYVAVVLILLGWAWAFTSATLFVYAAAVALAFQLRVVFGEEPWLARAFGERWMTYKKAVRRWF